MKITLFTSITHPINSGAGKNALSFAKALSQYTNHTIEIVCFDAKNKGKEVLVGKNNKAIEIRKISIKPASKLVKRLQVFKALVYYFKIVRETDIIIIYGPLIGYEQLILLARYMGKQSVFRSTMCGQDDVFYLVNKYGFLFRQIRKRIFDKVTYYYAINSVFTERYKKVFPFKNNVIESIQGVDIDIFISVCEQERRLLKRQYMLPQDKTIVLSVGYVINRKGYKGIIDALSKLDKEFLYVIVGDYDPEASEYLKCWPEKIKKEMRYLYEYGKAKLGDKVVFPGAVRENIQHFYQLSDVFILNSKKEGTPNVLLEAMATHNIVLCSNLPGIIGSLVVNEENALIHSNDDELLTNISRIFSHYHDYLHLADRAVMDIKNQYSFKDVVQRFMVNLIKEGHCQEKEKTEPKNTQ